MQPHGASAPMPVMDATLPFWTAFAMSAHGGAAAGRRTEWAGSPAAPRLAAPRAAALLVASVAQAAPHALDAVLALLPTGSGTSLADGHVPFFSPATHAALGRLSRATAGKLAAGVLATRSVPVALMRSPVIPLLVGDGAPSPVLRALACWLGDPAMQAAGPVAGTVRAVAPSGWAPPRLAAAAIFAMLHAADAARPTATHATVRPSLRLSPSLFCLCDAVSTLTVTREPRLGPATLLSVVSAPWVRPFRRYIVRRLARPPAPAPQAVSAGNRSPAPPADAPAEAAGVVVWEADLSRPSVHLPPDTLVEVADAALAAYAEGMRLAGIADIAAKSAASFVGAVRRSCGGGAAEFGGGGDGFGRHAAQPSGASVTVAGSVASVGAAAAPATSIGLDAELVAYRAPRHRERAAYLRAAGAALTLGVQVKGRAQAAAAFMAQRWPQLLARAAGMVGAAAAASQGLPAGEGSVISGIGGRAAPRSIGRSSVAGDARDVQLPWLRRVMGEAKLTVALGDGVLAAAAGGGTVPQAAASLLRVGLARAGAPLALFEVCEAVLPLASACASVSHPGHLAGPADTDALLGESMRPLGHGAPQGASGSGNGAAGGPVQRAAALFASNGILAAQAAGPFSLALDAVSAFAALHATAEGPLLRALRASLGFAADSLDAAGSPESVEGAAGAVWDSWRGSGAAMADTLVSLLESAAATAAALTRTVEELPAGIPPRMLAVRPDAVVRLARLGVVTLALVLLPSVLSDSAAAPDRVVAERRRLCARVSRAMLLCLVTACPPGMVPREGGSVARESLRRSWLLEGESARVAAAALRRALAVAPSAIPLFRSGMLAEAGWALDDADADAATGEDAPWAALPSSPLADVLPPPLLARVSDPGTSLGALIRLLRPEGMEARAALSTASSASFAVNAAGSGDGPWRGPAGLWSASDAESLRALLCAESAGPSAVASRSLVSSALRRHGANAPVRRRHELSPRRIPQCAPGASLWSRGPQGVEQGRRHDPAGGPVPA
ncbi:hypothetical protein FNF27_01933 [Cafeteria roenbergensis]|uniref:Uncharacterized protein n=1 Tax=Cafeteria roenbergensis TaxID=33653 RepID=A0A5A8EGK4_CAFRO|nr:hypothetical protein FNF27_01933 [Cafeteria roenbergensis]